MVNFNVVARRRRQELPANGPVQIIEGSYRGGSYHLIKLERHRVKAAFIVPPQLRNDSFMNDYTQSLSHGVLTDKETIDKAVNRVAAFRAAGRVALEQLLKTDPRIVLVSDASNYPYNEGHFAIQQGALLPLPPNSFPLTGKHYILSTAGGNISFPRVDLEKPKELLVAKEGFFVAQAIHEGRPVRLMDEAPGAGQSSISNYRGHPGQIFSYVGQPPASYAESQARLLELLHDPRANYAIIQDIINGRSVDFSNLYKLNIYTHTYWIESFTGQLYCLKTYPSADGKPTGVTFNEVPDFLNEIARVSVFRIKNAFIGTNGRDVRVILPRNGQPEAIRTLGNGAKTPLGEAKAFDRPLANFIAFSEV